VAIDTSGPFWRGADLADLTEYLREYEAAGYPVAEVVEAVCAGCSGRAFRLLFDDTEGCVQRTCTGCDGSAYLLDSAEYAADAELEPAECPCDGDAFAVAVGFARRADGDVRWVSVGTRCVADGVLGVIADWKIDYSPTAHLLTGV
jgi:hypothetical protein